MTEEDIARAVAFQLGQEVTLEVKVPGLDATYTCRARLVNGVLINIWSFQGRPAYQGQETNPKIIAAWGRDPSNSSYWWAKPIADLLPPMED